MTENTKPKYTVESIRQSWLDFFEKKDHLKLNSASLLPSGDPTLLFTTAGMVPFKNYFSGAQKPPSQRVVTIQKCLRTTDLEEVGKTDRHCTFFEMLGNFSFGDYFKKEAISFAWEYSLDVLKLDPQKIHITVYTEDDESEKIWKEVIGIQDDHITKLGKKDNWWGPAGDSGACGPCSELYIDRGPDHCRCKNPKQCKPGDDCERFMEYWNLVFNQFNQDSSGHLHKLPQTGIDTGAGLERLAALLNETSSVYETEEMIQIIRAIESLIPELSDDPKILKYDINSNPAPFRVITDHVRSSVFAIGDGIYPDNTGRGYVIRRLIRRALMFARELGIYQPILCKLVPSVIDIYKLRYPYLLENSDDIIHRIQIEEERFLNTLDQGLHHWSDFMAAHKKNNSKQFSGKDAFKLYDTFGFPLEMTRELAQKEGWLIDEEEFKLCMKEQQERSSAASSWKDFKLPVDIGLGSDSKTDFKGYANHSCESKILAILDDHNHSQSQIGEGAHAKIILDQTVFYAEGGGQMGDTGFLKGSDFLFEVTDTKKTGDWYLHIGVVKSGKVKVNDLLLASINANNRLQLERHHSSTHILNQALRNHLGDHIKQTGSMVGVDYLRFDFSHHERIDLQKLNQIEAQVIDVIQKKADVQTSLMPLEKATQSGAVATFGEKYDDTVRVVSMGDDGVDSRELCGGCHVKNTADIKFFHIIKESSPGAGNRRIEAIAGDPVIGYFQNQMDQLSSKINEFHAHIANLIDNSDQNLTIDVSMLSHTSQELLKNPRDVLELSQKIKELESDLAEAEKKASKLKKQIAKEESRRLTNNIDDFIDKSVMIGDTNVVRIELDDFDAKALRPFAQTIKQKKRNIVILIGVKSDKPVLFFSADQAAVASGIDCASLIKLSAPLIGGNGGGNKESAQAGGSIPENVSQALDLVLTELKK